MKTSRIPAAILLLGIAATNPAAASVLFSDTLQANLNQWTPGHGVIAAAPGGGKALTFSTKMTSGDIFTLKSFVSGNNSFTLQFDFATTSPHPQGAGAFLGANGGSPNSGGWILSDTAYGFVRLFPDSLSWERVSYTFRGTSTNLFLEDWSNAPYAAPNTIFFRNMKLTDNSEGIAIGTLSVNPVPEPRTFALWMAGLAIAGLMTRRQVRSKA
jgi:hypothetical protein